MSYANRKQLNQNRTVPIVLSALITFTLGYALVSGLAFNVVKKAAEDLKTFDVNEPPPPPEEKPPPPEKTDIPPPPQISAPPPLVRMETPAPPIQTTPVIQPPIITPTARPAPPAPPAPPPPKQSARAKANLASYFSDDDYPPSAQRNEEQGTTRFRLSIGTDGRVTDCQVTGSSGSSALDAATCSILRRRARYSPAIGAGGQPITDSDSGSIRWVLPAD